MRIDAHMHVNLHGFSPERIIAYLNENNFDRCWLLTWEEVDPGKRPGYQHQSIEDVYATYLRFPSRIIPMYAPDPHREDAPERLVYWYNRGIKGCAELKATLNWRSEKLKALLSKVSDLGIPLLFHMEKESRTLVPLESDNLIGKLLISGMNTRKFLSFSRKFLKVLSNYYPFRGWRHKRTVSHPGYMLDFESLEVILGAYPKVNFIGHGPLFWKNISAQVTAGGSKIKPYPQGPVRERGLTCRLLRDYPNLYADISGRSGFRALSRDPNFTKKFLSEFGYKMLFGTDNKFLGQEAFLESLRLPPSTLKQIYGENAYHLIQG
jgi:predicted TIM-barrel fold metal-dependent hydrolase